MVKITVSAYLVQELNKIGIEDFFGLPGDYNFNILDSIENNPLTNWIGCTNELNAGYAADGYARLNGYGAIVTTYNVGELSAMNALAGSFAENVPVISIVGMPATKFIHNNTLIHHNFIQPNYFAAQDAYKNFVQANAFLTANNAKDEIDRVLSSFIREKKPVYIAIPADVCGVLIKNDSELNMPQSNYKNLEKAVNHALKLINKSDSPVILGDILIDRFNAKDEFQNLVKNSGFPSTTFIMGKGLINESAPNFMGTYLASRENLDVYNTLNKSDCVVSIGTIWSDFNTLKFDISFKPEQYINIQGTHTTIENSAYEDVFMNDILYELSKQIKKREIQIKKNKPAIGSIEIKEEKPLDFDYIAPRFEKFLKPDDSIFVETGILEFLTPQLTLPDGCSLYQQLLWCSIGWATPATFGACIANREKRTILLTGEGSHQLTIQSLSNMAFSGVKPIIFVLNNSGYTIERVLSKNPKSNYNNIIPWDYTKIFEAFGGDGFTAKVKTNKEFDEVLNKIETEHPNRICYIELFTAEMDIPYIMKKYQKK